MPIAAAVFVLLALALPAGAEPLRFVTEDFPPFTYAESDAKDSSQAAGPLVEVVLAEQGAADGIFTVVRSPRREQAFHITRMLVTSRYSVFARESSMLVFYRAQDMAGRTVGVYGPSGTSDVLSRRLEQVDGVRVEVTPDNRRLLRMLAAGRFGEQGLAVVNQDVAWHLIEEQGLAVREVGELEPVSYGIGLSRRTVSAERFAAFENALDALIEDGTVPAILRRHRLQAAD